VRGLEFFDESMSLITTVGEVACLRGTIQDTVLTSNGGIASLNQT